MKNTIKSQTKTPTTANVTIVPINANGTILSIPDNNDTVPITDANDVIVLKKSKKNKSVGIKSIENKSIENKDTEIQDTEIQDTKIKSTEIINIDELSKFTSPGNTESVSNVILISASKKQINPDDELVVHLEGEYMKIIIEAKEDCPIVSVENLKSVLKRATGENMPYIVDSDFMLCNICGVEDANLKYTSGSYVNAGIASLYTAYTAFITSIKYPHRKPQGHRSFPLPRCHSVCMISTSQSENDGGYSYSATLHLLNRSIQIYVYFISGAMAAVCLQKNMDNFPICWYEDCMLVLMKTFHGATKNVQNTANCIIRSIISSYNNIERSNLPEWLKVFSYENIQKISREVNATNDIMNSLVQPKSESRLQQTSCTKKKLIDPIDKFKVDLNGNCPTCKSPIRGCACNGGKSNRISFIVNAKLTNTPIFPEILKAENAKFKI